MVGYNVQTAVDTKHHMIVAHEVADIGHDRDHLSSMAHQARDAVAEDTLTVFADRGYFKGEEILDCMHRASRHWSQSHRLPPIKLLGSMTKPIFATSRPKMSTDAPRARRAIWRYTSVERGLTTHKYWPSACPRCPMKSKCTTSDYRRVARWEHENVLEAMQKQLNRTPRASRIRRQTVEHPFGTLKAWMGATHFLTRTLPRVSTEMSLHVLAYNIKRAMQIFGVARLMRAMRA